MKLVIAVVVASISTAIFSSPSFGEESNLAIESRDIKQTLVEEGRGAALAVLQDGSLLLAGGKTGNSLYIYQNNELVKIGNISTQKERLRDPRFGPTDIGVLSQSVEKLNLLISYPQFQSSKNCVRLVAFRYTVDRKSQTLKKQERWFAGRPCVPVGAVQHAAGRIEVIDAKTVYLTTGDLGYRKIDDRNSRGWLGGVFKVSDKQVKQISQGHRNPQGIALVNGSLYISEHGPRGGDELNLIEDKADYGWPFVTFGAPYGAGDYIKPTKSGTHAGFTEPLFQWTPSVAPTELALLPNSQQWGVYKNQIVMGSLAAQSLYFIELNSRNKVGKVSTEYVGERIRDLELMPNGKLVATTDGGELLFISLN